MAAALLAALLTAWLSPVVASTAHAGAAEAAQGRYTIGIMLSPPADGCFDAGFIRSIEHFLKRRLSAVNGLPELKDRRLQLEVFNDNGDDAQAVANVRKAIADPTMLAMIGLAGAKRGKAVFEQAGKEIGDRGIPFITDISVTSLFSAYGNVFTMRPSQESERLPVITRFMWDGKYQRPAYIGMTDSPASAELLKGLSDRADMATLAAVNEVTVKDNVIDAAELKSTIEDFKKSDADLIIVMLGAEPVSLLLKAAADAGLRAPMLILSDSEKVLTSEPASLYGANLYQLAWQTLPNIYNNRLREQMLAERRGPWIFEDVANPKAAGWASGKCKAPENKKPLRQLDPANLRAIGRGTIYADMLGLVGEIVQYASPDLDLQGLRSTIVKSMTTKYAAGRGAFRGDYDNWSFQTFSRTASQTPAILMKARRSSQVGLAPRQYMKMRNDDLRPIQTLFMDADLTRVFRIDDNEKSFFAEFFLTISSPEPFDVSNIEFSNAFLDTASGGQNITITPLGNGQGNDGLYPDGVQVYRVTGKFMMRPDFKQYPFDTQLFTVKMKPKSGRAAFIVQPPSENLRDSAAETDGWMVRDQFVGYDEDYIPIIDARNEQRSIVPFYQVGYSWIMTREATDYYLRVVVPLAFILIVAYLSIFIPRDHFEAVVTIQVTALLSAVALYLSIPKVGSDDATISDRIFLFDYLAVSVMIAISVARVNGWIRRFPRFDGVLKYLHMLGIPLMVLAMAYYVSTTAAGKYATAWHEDAPPPGISIPVKSGSMN